MDAEDKQVAEAEAETREFAEASARFRGLIDADWIEAQQPFEPAAVYTAVAKT